MVGTTGLEPAASWSQTKHSTKLSYVPILMHENSITVLVSIQDAKTDEVRIKKMADKTVIVTGGSRGIGAATAKIFAQNDYRVVLTYLEDASGAKNIAESIRKEYQEASVFQYDASSPEAAKALVSFTIDRYKQIDVLVNNAGISLSGLVSHTSDEEWNRLLDVNLTGVFYLTREVSKYMIAHKRGSIVNVSSVYGISGAANESAYSAAKAGIIGFSKAVAKELATSNITVNCVAPGVIDTKMNEWLTMEERKELCNEIPIGRFGTPFEVAEAIYFLANHSYITGQVLSIDGGYMI